MSSPAMSRAEAERLLAEVKIHEAFGLELTEWEHGAVRFSFRPPALSRAGEGGVHGGALLTALDTAACFAAIAAVGQDCFTVDLRSDFLRPALDEQLTVRGTLLRAGKRFACADATLTSPDDRLLAVARGTFIW